MKDIPVRTSKEYPIYVDFVPDNEVGDNEVGGNGRLGMTLAPGMKAETTHGEWRWERDLATDMRKLRELKVDLLVSVMEEHEYRGYEILDLYEKDEVEGVKIRRCAIKDMDIPTEKDEYEALIRDIVSLLLEEKKTVVVHCRGGLGRTGTVAACVLVARGKSAKEAVEVVRATRKRAIQTDPQEQFVYRFEASLAQREGGNS